MKHLLTLLFLSAACVTAMAETNTYVLCEAPSHEEIATFDMTNSALYTVEATLTGESNKVEIIQTVAGVTNSYGPDWSGLSSTKSDNDGYCWWNCPEFDKNNKVTTSIQSTSGTNNHIGIILPKGSYRLTFDRQTGNNAFVVEKINPTGLKNTHSTQSTMRKTVINGRMVFICNGKMYNALGQIMQ